MKRVDLLSIAAAALIASAAADAHAQGTLLERGRDFFRRLDGPPPKPTPLTEAEIRDGLREALRLGAERVVGTLGVKDGFNGRSDIRISLPGALTKVLSTLDRYGVNHVADEAELRLNRAAEAAVPRAERLFRDAIRDLPLTDFRAILNGPQDSATRIFRAKMAAPLTAEMKPIVDQELVNVGAVRAYDDMIRQYRSFPFVPDVTADLASHVLERTVDGIFLYLAREEAAIRNDPVKRTSRILERVFGGG